MARSKFFKPSAVAEVIALAGEGKEIPCTWNPYVQIEYPLKDGRLWTASLAMAAKIMKAAPIIGEPFRVSKREYAPGKSVIDILPVSVIRQTNGPEPPTSRPGLPNAPAGRLAGDSHTTINPNTKSSVVSSQSSVPDDEFERARRIIAEHEARWAKSKPTSNIQHPTSPVPIGQSLEAQLTGSIAVIAAAKAAQDSGPQPEPEELAADYRQPAVKNGKTNGHAAALANGNGHAAALLTHAELSEYTVGFYMEAVNIAVAVKKYALEQGLDLGPASFSDIRAIAATGRIGAQRGGG